MLKTLLACILVFSVCETKALYSATTEFQEIKSVDCDPALQSCLSAIEKLPEARKLIAAVQQEGPIRIRLNTSPFLKQFKAFWDPDNRIIYINKFDRTEGQMISSIIFELHNAVMSSKLNYVDHLASAGKIDKENYIKSVEFIEFQNSKNAAKLLETGVKTGVFPKDAYLHTYDSFEEHYHWQQYGGHSAWIGNTFEQITHGEM